MRGEGETAAKAKRRPALMGRFRRNRWNLGCAFLQYGQPARNPTPGTSVQVLARASSYLRSRASRSGNRLGT